MNAALENSPFEVGQTVYANGVFTQLSVIMRPSHHEVGMRLGFMPGHLSQGYTVAYFTRTPSPNEWSFRRYTQFIDAPVEPEVDEDAPLDLHSHEERLTDSGLDVPAMKMDVNINVFRTSGPHRLIKVIPVINANGMPEYPERTGSPQWLLNGAFPTVVAGFVPPGAVFVP